MVLSDTLHKYPYPKNFISYPNDGPFQLEQKLPSICDFPVVNTRIAFNPTSSTDDKITSRYKKMSEPLTGLFVRLYMEDDEGNVSGYRDSIRQHRDRYSYRSIIMAYIRGLTAHRAFGWEQKYKRMKNLYVLNVQKISATGAGTVS